MVRTEREMHAAWRKRAEQAEAPMSKNDEQLVVAWVASGGGLSDDGRAAAWEAELPKVLRGVMIFLQPKT